MRDATFFSFFLFRIPYSLAISIQTNVSLCIVMSIVKIPISVLSYLHVELRSDLWFLKVVFNLGASEIKVENISFSFF